MLNLRNINLQQVKKAIHAQLINAGHRLKPICGISTDSRHIKRGDIFIALTGERFDGHDFIHGAVEKGASCVVSSSDISCAGYKVPFLKVSDTNKALGELARFCRKQNKDIPLIAVTGSAGKTTTKEIISHILSRRYHPSKNFGTFNNHIGVPLTILQSHKRQDICVLELGTNHFGEIAYLANIAQPQVGVITNIGASHLEFLKNLQGVFKEKTSLVSHLEKPKILILNKDDYYLGSAKFPKGIKVFTFGINKKSDFMAHDLEVSHRGVSFKFNNKHRVRLKTLGRFNAYNVLVGIGCGLIFGINITDIVGALESFQFPSQRLKKIIFNKAFILDDTYNSNPTSLLEAINTLSEFKDCRRRILVMGDMLELGESADYFHKHIGTIVGRRPINIFMTLGELSRSAANSARKESNRRQEVFSASSYDEIVVFLRNNLQEGDVLLVKGSRLLKMENIVASLINN